MENDLALIRERAESSISKWEYEIARKLRIIEDKRAYIRTIESEIDVLKAHIAGIKIVVDGAAPEDVPGQTRMRYDSKPDARPFSLKRSILQQLRKAGSEGLAVRELIERMADETEFKRSDNEYQVVYGGLKRLGDRVRINESTTPKRYVLA